MKTESNFVSVIIPTINRTTLKTLLDALSSQTRPPDEVIVMEDKLRLGPSVMRNRGIEKSRGDLIAFLDDDVVPGQKWLEVFIDELKSFGADGVYGNYEETDPLLSDIRKRRKFPEEAVINSDKFFGLGGNCLYKRSCLEDCRKKYGFIFNPLLMAGEDVDIQWRLRSSGFKLVYVSNKVQHLKQLNPFQFLVFQYKRGESIEQLNSLKKSFGNLEACSGLLWNEYAEKHPLKKWVKIFREEILGPFDYLNFSRPGYFFLFWFGEKAKAFGFLVSLSDKKIRKLLHLNRKTGSDKFVWQNN